MKKDRFSIFHLLREVPDIREKEEQPGGALEILICLGLDFSIYKVGQLKPVNRRCSFPVSDVFGAGRVV